ncbi:MAG: tRNA (adenosine(37)-N6)-threonylcarbamoyltransferase complex ATPase subunit type 1 TsaE [Nitrospirae bacterium]|nr:tRNA (adenosine(37)-N6)-threonylcarbamoyltransferase complex ATPase subunit type 1 TsaE [Nitrospirota bacterium]
MKLLSRSPAETEAIGYKLGRSLRAGMMVKLYGELGAGKTTMTKGIARAFGINQDDVISPSFTIITEYRSTPRFYHLDLYRIAGSRDLESTGIWDCIGEDSVTVVEWPEHAEDELPKDAVTVRISHQDLDERAIEIEGIDEKDWHNLQA